MRKSGSWMTIWDDRILEYATKEDSATPKKLDESGLVRISKSQISRRLSTLADNGLLQPLGNGVYVITDEGEAYLKGDYDAEAGMYVEDGAGQVDGPTTTEDGASPS